jgi:hypothetical protein
LTNFIQMRSKRPGWAAAGRRSLLISALSGRRRFLVDFDELDETLDAEVGERQDAVVVETVDPDDNVLDVHFDAVARPDPRLFRGRQRSRDRERGHEMAGRSRLRHRRRVPRLGGVDARLNSGEDFVAADFAKLRDPAELGSVLNNDLRRFSMLTPNASLWAWLIFADDNNPHAAEALGGARKLSHRTSDAVAWLSHPNSNADGAF